MRQPSLLYPRISTMGLNFHKVVSHIERINSIEAEASSQRFTAPSPTSKPTAFESIELGQAWDLLRGFFVSNAEYIAIATAVFFILMNTAFWRLASILTRGNPAKRGRGYGKRLPASEDHPTHLCVVLGSGGHTAEMLAMLRSYPGLINDYTYRTYIVSAGDDFSAIKADDFEKELASSGPLVELDPAIPDQPPPPTTYDIITITRARRVHQSIFTTPSTVWMCLRDCLRVLRGVHQAQNHAGSAHTSPDLILTNGPGTGVCVIVASIILLFFGAGGSTHDGAYHSSGQMRTVYIESWARVKSLSLSGRIIMPLVDRFVVQWETLQRRVGEKEKGGKAEYVGVLAA